MMSARAFPPPRGPWHRPYRTIIRIDAPTITEIRLALSGLACSDVIPAVQGTPVCLTSSLLIVYATSLAKPGNREPQEAMPYSSHMGTVSIIVQDLKLS